MPRIPTYQQKRLPQPTSGVRVSPEAMTKDIEAVAGFGQAMAGAGDLAMQFAQKLEEAEVESQVNLSMGLYKKGLEEFRRNHAISKETDWSKTEKDLGTIQSQLDKNASSVLTQPLAKAEYDRQKQIFNLVYDKALFNSTNSNRVSLIIEQTKFAAELAIEQRDPVTLKKVYSNAADSKAMNKEVADTKLKLGLIEIEENIEKDIYEAVWNQAKTAPTKELANDIVRAANLKPNQEKALILGIKHHYEDQEAKIKQAEIDTADKWVTDSLVKLRDKKLTFEGDILNAPKRINREHWTNVLDKQNKAIADGKVDPLTIIDPAVDYETMQKVYSSTPPEESEITTLVGNGLSVKRAEHWIGILKKPDRGYKRALDYLKSQIMPSKGLLVGESSEEATAYWNSVIALDEQMQKAIDDGKPLTGNEILKESMKIAPVYMMTITERIEALKKQFSQEKQAKEIKRTGTINGRKVIEYLDGSIEYAD